MLSKLSHMQTRNDVQSYIAANCCWSQFRPGYIRLLLLFIVVVVVVVIFVHSTNFLQSCCSLLLLQRVHASGFLISFPVHVCVLFILSSNNNYVCFARLMYILICDNSAHIQRIHGALLVKKTLSTTSIRWLFYPSVLPFNVDKLTGNYYHRTCTCSNDGDSVCHIDQILWYYKQKKKLYLEKQSGRWRQTNIERNSGLVFGSFKQSRPRIKLHRNWHRMKSKEPTFSIIAIFIIAFLWHKTFCVTEIIRQTTTTIITSK